MIYKWPKRFENHWYTIYQMIEENYAPMVLNSDSVHIVFALYLTKSVKELKQEFNSSYLIVYQTEPLVANHWWSTETIIKNLDGADEVWDYDIENIKILLKHGINAKYRPPAYTDQLKTIKNIKDPDIDLLFYGIPTNRRMKFLADFITVLPIIGDDRDIFSKIRFVNTYNVFDAQLDELLGRSKIILNINPQDGECRQQQTRIFYALINNKCVLSEMNKFNYYGNLIVEFNGLEDFAAKLFDLLTNDKWKTYTKNDYKQYSNSRVIER